MGKVSAGTAAARLQCSYPELEVVFLAGICGGIPEVQSPNGAKREVLLGDVVVSSHMVQYDFGRRYQRQLCDQTAQSYCEENDKQFSYSVENRYVS